MNNISKLRYDLALIGAHAKYQSVLSRNIISDIYPGNEIHGEAEILVQFFHDLYSELSDIPDSEFMIIEPEK